MDHYKEPPTFEAMLRGVSHRPIEAKAIVKDLKDGDELILERDARNEYDPNAIQVIDRQLPGDRGEHLGFVAKEVACDIAPWMDSGWQFTCTVNGRVSASVVILEIVPVMDDAA